MLLLLLFCVGVKDSDVILFTIVDYTKKGWLLADQDFILSFKRICFPDKIKSRIDSFKLMMCISVVIGNNASLGRLTVELMKTS